MRKLIASTFVSLDGVMQAPGGPEEDPTGGFDLGGWSFSYWGDDMDASMSGFDAAGRDLVLGRRTYEIFEAFWPYQSADDPTARSLNAARKFVASRTLDTVEWNNATLLQGDATHAIAALKQTAGPDLQIIGSGNLIHSLQATSLIDEFNVWIFPVVLGKGKRLFSESAMPASLKLVRSKVAASGVVMTTYAPAGPVEPGSFVQGAPSAKELARRQKLSRS